MPLLGNRSLGHVRSLQKSAKITALEASNQRFMQVLIGIMRNPGLEGPRLAKLAEEALTADQLARHPEE